MKEKLISWTVHCGLLVALGASSCARVDQATSHDAAANDAPNPPTPYVLERPANPSPVSRPTSIFEPSSDVIDRIREEGLNRSEVMATLGYLSDVIGPRLTGSPNLHRANAWTRDKLSSWGLSNAHLEPWGPFGRGWSLKRYSAQLIEPQNVILIGFPKAWSPGLKESIVAPVVYLDAKQDQDLEKYRGKLKGAVVLISPVREIQPRFEPMAIRVGEGDLLKLANADGIRVTPYPGAARSLTPSERRGLLPGNLGRRSPATSPALQPATTAPAANAPAAARRSNIARNILPFLVKEGAAVVVDSSTQGDGGTLFVASASLPTTRPIAFNDPNAPRSYSPNAPATLPQITLAVENYNRLVRMIQSGEQLKMAVDLEVEFHDRDRMAYNTIAEIPGTDLKDQIVMIGAHLDSWHSGTGATDNGAGVAAAMEAMRILKALDLHPRRTIRIGLWTGEEEGLLGSKAYVAQHFGKWSESPAPRRSAGTRPTTRPKRELLKLPEYDRLSVYYNLDNGTGKIRGVYMEGNELVRPIFRKWIAPFTDLEAQTLSAGKVVGTDHQSFDAIGLPAFQFIQDPIEYWTRTHHSNQDVFDHASGDDLKQAATIMATFLYDAAMTSEKLPRKED